MIKNSLSDWESLKRPVGVMNLGGMINRIRLLPIQMVERIDTQGGVILPVDGLVLKANAAYCDIEIVVRTGRWEQNMVDGEHGIYYNNTVGFEMAMERPEIAIWLMAHREMRFLILIEDKNRFVRVLGSSDFPMRFVVNKTSIGQLGGKNGRNIDFIGESLHECYYMDAADNSFEIAGTPISMHGTGAIGNQTYQLIMQLRNGAGFLRYRHFFFDKTEVIIPKTLHGMSEILSVLLLRLDGYQIYTEINAPIDAVDTNQTVRIRFSVPVSGVVILS
jgi:hypothetical protein